MHKIHVKPKSKIKKPKLNPVEVKKAHNELLKLKKEIAKAVVGQEQVINSVIKGLLCNGHVLMEGLPGIAKTLIIRAMAVATGCDFKRVQFTVDLLPSDVLGLIRFSEKKGFETIKGPVFTNFVIADEINRAPPKTQSALLEAMQERQATIGKKTFSMMNPFFVMATQNPIESTGVYPLPEAQIDRFLFWITVGYPSPKEELAILHQNITLSTFEELGIKPVISPKRIIALQKLTQKIYMDPAIERYLVEIVDTTRQPDKYKLKLGKYIECGASPRASIGLFIAAKADALINGARFVSPHNIKNVAFDVLRKRILLNYEGEAENIKPDDVIREILKKVPIP